MIFGDVETGGTNPRDELEAASPAVNDAVAF